MDKRLYVNKMVESRGSTTTIWLKNTAPTVLHGKDPMATFRVLCDKHGTPLNREMRRRVKDGDFIPVSVEAKKTKETK